MSAPLANNRGSSLSDQSAPFSWRFDSFLREIPRILSNRGVNPCGVGQPPLFDLTLDL